LLPLFVLGQEEFTDSVTIKALEDFDLYSLPDIAESVGSFEELETAINDSSTHINNVDLNEDGEVDYLKVTEISEGEVRSALITAILSDKEEQTIAVIEMERVNENEASLQLIGEESFYGEEIILEPEEGLVDISASGGETPSDGNKSGGPNYILEALTKPPVGLHVTIVWVAYQPGYVLWVSPVVWGIWPAWYHPWPRFRRSAWRRHHHRVHHRRHYRRTTTRRSHAARGIHHNNKRTSPRSPGYNSNPRGGQPNRGGTKRRR
jgi:hypothetical protein